MSSGAKHADEFSILAGEAEKTRARLIDIIAKHTRRPRAEIEARIAKNAYFDAAEAV